MRWISWHSWLRQHKILWDRSRDILAGHTRVDMYRFIGTGRWRRRDDVPVIAVLERTGLIGRVITRGLAGEAVRCMHSSRQPEHYRQFLFPCHSASISHNHTSSLVQLACLSTLHPATGLLSPDPVSGGYPGVFG
jgi:hypothetical protein